MINKYPDERYLVDSEFAMLVNHLYMLIKQCKFTSTDIREAAMLAQMKWEQFNPRPITVSTEMLNRIAMMDKIKNP